jgi:dihydrofolate reductase
MLSIIAAIGQNRELGKEGQLLWHLPKDFNFFKENTTGKIMIMGRKTFESIGRPLPRRKSIVITSQDEWNHEGVITAKSMNDAIEKAEDFQKENQEFSDEIFIIGGGDVYRQSLPYIDTIYLTEVAGSFPYADTFFPEWDTNKFKEISRKHHEKDPEHEFDFDFVVYKK